MSKHETVDVQTPQRTSATTGKSPKKAKPAYHHGELRQALIDATRALVIERGAENFSLADACRRAGVSTAAPYRHFRDKDEILGEVLTQSFDAMAERQERVAAPFERGSLERIVAIGRDYVDYAMDETPLFRLMFGQNPKISQDDDVSGEGKKCFTFVIEEVAAYIEKTKRPGNPLITAVQLWTLVHGAACLRIEDNYNKVAPGIDVDEMIADAARKLL